MLNLHNPSGCLHLRKRRAAKRNHVGDLLSLLAALCMIVTRGKR